MTKDKNRLLLEKQVSQPRKLSRAAKRAMAEAGKKNLEAWRERAQEASANAIAEIDAFRTDIFAALGASPTVTQRALAENAVMTYASIVLVNKELRRPRNPQRMAVIEKASWLSGNLTRLLKLLALDARPRPRTLADILQPNVAPNGAKSPTNTQ